MPATQRRRSGQGLGRRRSQPIDFLAAALLLFAVTYASADCGEPIDRDGSSTAAASSESESLDASQASEGLHECEGVVVAATPFELLSAETQQTLEADRLFGEGSFLRTVTLLQPTPFQQPRISSSLSVSVSTQAPSLTARLFAQGAVDQSLLRQARTSSGSFRIDVIRGSEAGPLSTTDLGSLLKKSKTSLSTEVQRRTPIVNDPRIRSSRVGALAASGSYWVPARADLDTVVSKFDSRLIDDVVVIPGPYSSIYGPGLHFVDFRLKQSPRSSRGPEWSGRTAFDYGANGDQWLGLQSISSAGSNWGMRLDYAHRGGSDYRAGNDDLVPSSYSSREWNLSLGRDFQSGDSIEFSAIRLDQTDVEFPGYVFDLDVLVTDGYEVTYHQDRHWWADRADTETWYNRTWFEGNAQNPRKAGQFPILDAISYVGFTDVDSLSIGYRRALGWGDDASYQIVVGHDLRFIKQELNERSSGLPIGGFIPIVNANSPVPRSYSVNPGLFASYTERLCRHWTFGAGGRIDYFQSDVVDDPQKLQELTFSQNPATIDEILGTDRLQTDRLLLSLYMNLQRRFNDCLVGGISLGYAERPPTLTELYAVQPFLLLLQNGLTTVTGDPLLDDEKLIQFDVNLEYDTDSFRAGVRGFYGWAFDYITFENMRTLRSGPNNEVQQVSLKYVNTDLATMTGFESFVELLPGERFSPFATVRYVDGRDRTRNGDFATRPGEAGIPSVRTQGLSRGAFSFVPGSDSEPLPGISPLESRVGVRLNDTARRPEWNVELSARIVDNQDRIATSLLESATAGFTTWDLRGTYQPAAIDGLILVSGVENFTDKTYREHLDFRSPTGASVFQPGANFYFGVDRRY